MVDVPFQDYIEWENHRPLNHFSHIEFWTKKSWNNNLKFAFLSLNWNAPLNFCDVNLNLSLWKVVANFSVKNPHVNKTPTQFKTYFTVWRSYEQYHQLSNIFSFKFQRFARSPLISRRKFLFVLSFLLAWSLDKLYKVQPISVKYGEVYEFKLFMTACWR